MKTLLLSIYLLASIILAGHARASDLESLYPDQLKQAKDIYPLAQRYFRGPGSLKPGESLTPEMLKDPARQDAYYKLRRLLGLAIDAGYDLSYLAPFGLVKEKWGYSVNFRDYPQWAEISSLFFSMRASSDLKGREYLLLRKGFNQQDIETLRDYLDNNSPAMQSNLAEQQLIKRHARQLKPRQPGQTPALNDLVSIHESVRRNRFDSWNRWGVALLNRFSPQKQRILLDYLQGRLGGMAIGGMPMNKEYLQDYGEQIASGKELKRLSAQLDEIKEKAIKE